MADFEVLEKKGWLWPKFKTQQVLRDLVEELVIGLISLPL
jgi:hypothetical protein